MKVEDYIIQYANAQKNLVLGHEFIGEESKQEMIKKIQNAIKCRELGLITVNECIKMIYDCTSYEKRMGTIIVPVNDGFLVAGRNADAGYDGIYIVFETNDGDVIDIVTTACKEDEDKKKINIYSYLDVYSDDYTSKDTIDIDKIYDALG